MRSFDFEYQVEQQPLLLPDAAVVLTRKDLSAGDAGVDEAGFYHGALLRQGVRRWDFSYKVLTGQEYRYLLELFSGRSSFRFRFRAEDHMPSETLCHTDGCKAEFFDRRQDIYRDVSFSVKEC